MGVLRWIGLKKPEAPTKDEQQFHEEMTQSSRERDEVWARLKALEIYVDVMGRGHSQRG